MRGQMRMNQNIRLRALGLMCAASLAFTTAMMPSAVLADNHPQPPSYELVTDERGEQRIEVRGRGSVITMADLDAAATTLGVANGIVDQGDGVWEMNVSVRIRTGVTLNMVAPAVTWLRLRSESRTATSGSFVVLDTYSGRLFFDGIKVSSWDSGEDDYDKNYADGRAYLLAKFDASMDFRNTQVWYLGYAEGESYGISWRDINTEDTPPGTYNQRVTGRIFRSEFAYNYFGGYTYQASGMTVRESVFRNNVSYGFDPHDFTVNLVIEDNQFHSNGNHGLVLSRGVSNAIVRRNKSFGNRYTVDNQDRGAQGFMLDPGSPTSTEPQVPSSNNIFEFNEAWDNDGFGFRVLKSDNNVIRRNKFWNNEKGITIEGQSVGNVVEDNDIYQNQRYGIVIEDDSDRTYVALNTVTGNGDHGIFVRASRNEILTNTVSGNVGSGIMVAPARDDWGEVLRATTNEIRGNTVVSNTLHGIDMRAARTTEVMNNVVANNQGDGVYMSSYVFQGSQNTLVTGNTIFRNGGYGIKANGDDTLRNEWNNNSIFENADGGIRLSNMANGGLRPPTITLQTSTTVSGVTVPFAVVEIYSDNEGQGRFPEGKVIANADGTFTFAKGTVWTAPNLNVVATLPTGDGRASSSEFRNISRTRIILRRVVLPAVINRRR
jgi:parallel beta-helix repeat protein